MSVRLECSIPDNVVEIGNEVAQGMVDALNAADNPTATNPLLTKSAGDAAYLEKDGGGTVVGTVVVDTDGTVGGNTATITGTKVEVENFGVGKITIDPVLGVTFPDGTSQGTAAANLVTSVAGKTGAVALDVADVSGAAPTASPALTGTPTAPTAAAATNTTQIATTAFVQQEVPAASTTAAGKVQLATEAQAQAKTSTTTAVTPDELLASHIGWVSGLNTITTAVSTGIVTSHNYGSRCRLTASASGQYAIAYPPNGSINSFTTIGSSYDSVNFSKRIRVYARCYTNMVANLNAYYAFGRSNNTATTIGSPATKGFGIRIQGTGAVELQVHDGTTLTNVTSSFTPTSTIVFEVLLDSLGTGTVNLYINGSLVATSNAGPTGNNAGYPLLIQELSSTASSSQGDWFVEGRALYFA